MNSHSRTGCRLKVLHRQQCFECLQSDKVNIQDVRCISFHNQLTCTELLAVKLGLGSTLKNSTNRILKRLQHIQTFIPATQNTIPSDEQALCSSTLMRCSLSKHAHDISKPLQQPLEAQHVLLQQNRGHHQQQIGLQQRLVGWSSLALLQTECLWSRNVL